MQVKLLTRTGTIQDMVRFAAKAAQTTRGNADKEIFANEQEELLKRIIKLGHESILEHIYLTYSVKGLSRACLQELARHRHITLSVESSRYTLRKFLIDEPDVLTTADFDKHSEFGSILGNLARIAREYPDMSNDELKYYLPEFWPTNLIMSSNIRELRHIIKLRTAPAALAEFRELAREFYNVVPSEFKFLLQDCVHEETSNA